MGLTYLLIFKIIQAKHRPQKDEFVCVYQVFCLRPRDTGCSILVEDSVFSGDLEILSI